MTDVVLSGAPDTSYSNVDWGKVNGSVIIPVALRVFCAILGIFKSMQRDCHGKIISSYR